MPSSSSKKPLELPKDVQKLKLLASRKASELNFGAYLVPVLENTKKTILVTLKLFLLSEFSFFVFSMFLEHKTGIQMCSPCFTCS